MGAVTVVGLEDVEATDLSGGSWSRMLVTSERARGNAASLGCSHFVPGAVVGPVRHEAEEVAYVVCGRGELRLDDEAVPFATGDALHIPAGVWHAVANTGDDPLVMVFGFPWPDYPPTERR